MALDDRQTVAAYLTGWLDDKRHALKPKTLHQYREYVTKDLIPALGGYRLEHLRHDHVRAYVADLEAATRGVTTIRRIMETLSSALSDAVRQRRLVHNVARFAPLPAEQRTEPVVWTAAQAVAFLDHAHQSGERLADLFEVIAGTGLRRGEALALRWSDIDLESRVLVVHPERGNLSDVAGELTFHRAEDARELSRGRTLGSGSGRTSAATSTPGCRACRVGYGLLGPGFRVCQEDGSPLRPTLPLERLIALTESAGLPRIRLHDLRHLAATLMLTNGVPLPLVSKTLRHSKVGITADLYGHLTNEAAIAAADTLGGVLDAAAAELASERAAHDATTLRPHENDRDLLDGSFGSVCAGREVAS